MFMVTSIYLFFSQINQKDLVDKKKNWLMENLHTKIVLKDEGDAR